MMEQATNDFRLNLPYYLTWTRDQTRRLIECHWYKSYLGTFSTHQIQSGYNAFKKDLEFFSVERRIQQPVHERCSEPSSF
jgi:hypothetical protein